MNKYKDIMKYMQVRVIINLVYLIYVKSTTGFGMLDGR